MGFKVQRIRGSEVLGFRVGVEHEDFIFTFTNSGTGQFFKFTLCMNNRQCIFYKHMSKGVKAKTSRWY